MKNHTYRNIWTAQIGLVGFKKCGVHKVGKEEQIVGLGRIGEEKVNITQTPCIKMLKELIKYFQRPHVASSW